jgi:DNA invertase Pin-like site-specific DNA recombinase
MKAIILARVSSKEQEDGYSLSAQISRLTEFATRKNLTVVETYQFIESSTKGKRKQFNEILKFCKSQKETIAIVADAVDRVQRSFKESITLHELVQKGKIELHFYKENLVISKDSRSTDIMRWDFSVMAAKAYVLQLSDNVKRSLDFKMKNGQWASLAPLGYKNVRDSSGKGDIKLDDNAPLVKQVFEKYSMGKMSFKELSVYAKKIGLKSARGNDLQVSQLQRLIANPFYYGIMYQKGQLKPHCYEKLITKELWDRCQRIRTRHDKNSFKYAEKQYLFRGMIRCANTGKICSTDTKKGYINYIICYDENGKRQYIREEVVLEQVEKIFMSIKIPEEIIQLIASDLKKQKENEIAIREQSLASLKKDYETVKTRLDRLIQFYLDGKIDEDIYQEKSAQFKREKAELQESIDSCNKADDCFNDLVVNLLRATRNIGDVFCRSSNFELKRQLLKIVIRTLELKGGNLGFELASPFDSMLNWGSHRMWGKICDSIRTLSIEELRLTVEALNECLAA